MNKPIQFPPLIDSFGRVHNNLRLSVTDRCNIRCFYCMPNSDVKFQPRSEILTFNELFRVCEILSRSGVNKIRITGGEPLVRSEVVELVREIRKISAIKDLSMTTNGILLAEHAESLKQAGLDRINISLDTLNEQKFEAIARRKGLQKVLDGITAAKKCNFKKIRLNAIAIKDLSESEVLPLARFARSNQMELRFIEFMPLDAEGNWDQTRVLSGESILRILESEFGEIQAAPRSDPSQPAVDFSYADGGGIVGFINPVSQPFCRSCNRLRLTAEGKIRNCLFSETEWDIRGLLRSGANDEEIIDEIRNAIESKQPGHGIDSENFVQPKRAMYQIGG